MCRYGSLTLIGPLYTAASSETSVLTYLRCDYELDIYVAIISSPHNPQSTIHSFAGIPFPHFKDENCDLIDSKEGEQEEKTRNRFN